MELPRTKRSRMHAGRAMRVGLIFAVAVVVHGSILFQDNFSTPGLWLLANATGGIHKILGFGSGAAKPVAGDWGGNGTTNIGVFDNGLWYLSDDAGGI